MKGDGAKMAEEDLIFGKNRHMFGGIEPSNMRTFVVKKINDRARIKAELPFDTIVDNQLLCTVKGAVIRRKESGYPVDEFDGDLVADITSSGIIWDDNFDTTKTQYYAAFPYSAQGVYNKGNSNRFKLEVSTDIVLGFDINLSITDPEDRVTYPDTVYNKTFTPAHMNYTSDQFEYGGWSDPIAKSIFMPKPVSLSISDSDGVVVKYLNENDYTKFEDGSSTSGSYFIMMQWPKIYTHREVVNGVYKFRCASSKIDSDWDCWCNYDKNNNIIENFYTAVYMANSRLISQSYNYATSESSVTPYNFASPVQAIGHATRSSQNHSTNDDWCVETLADRLLIQDLLIMMAKSTDCQTAYGKGNCDNSSKLANGTMDTKGLFWGSNDTTHGVKVFGMENFWGNYKRLVVGYVNGESGTIYVKLTRGTHDGSTASDYSTEFVPDTANNNCIIGNGYLSLTNVDISTQATAGYISNTITQPYGRFPIYPPNGSSTVYEADYIALTDNSNLYNTVFGGDNTSGVKAGPFCIESTIQNHSNNTKCYMAISCKPCK